MIEFANPSALWLLMLAVPLILLYLLKRRRQDVVVPSLLLWKQALEDMRAHRPFQKLRSQLLLYLQLLILTLITAILSGPRLVQSSQLSRRWVLVLDTSASMQATDAAPDRFRAARDRLLQSLDQASAADEVLLLAAGAETSVIQPFTTDHSAVRRKMLEMQPQDAAGNWPQLAFVLEPLLKERPIPHVVIASDFSGLPQEWKGRIPFDALPVGTSGDNVAITRAAADPLADDPSRQQLFYEIRNYSARARTVDVELRIDARVADAYTVEIAGNTAVNRTADLTVMEPAEVRLQIKPADALLIDNEFVLEVAPAKPLQVRSAYRNPFLLKALAAIPAAETDDPSGVLIDQAETDVRTAPGIYFLKSGAAAAPGRVLQWNTGHPALRFVDAGIWAFARCSTLQPPADAAVLLETARGPVAYAHQTEKGRIIVLGFLLEDSNLVQLAGFPVFLRNAVSWVAEGMQKKPETLTGPQRPKKGPFKSDGIPGYANFADAAESRIEPGRVSATSTSGTHALQRRSDLSLWFLLLALAIVMVEWWSFHRRTEL